LLVAQSGGPTCAINASVAGVVTEAGKHGAIAEIYGGLNGILGILNENLCDLNEEKARAIEGLKFTPSAALGTCRYKIDFTRKPENAARDMDRLFEVFQAHEIRYFFYAGGNDSQDTSHKIHLEAVRRGWEMRVIGIPKTIDNDLPHTDHCPGYGSVIKYCAATVMEVGLDVGSMATDDGSCCIIEVMGRSAGWIAAGTILAKRAPHEPPHIILVPEIRYDIDAVLEKIRETVQQYRYCVIVVGEGIKNKEGEEIGADKSIVDAFGHPLLSGAADRIAGFVHAKLGTKTRTVKLGYAQRSAAHFASATDIAEVSAAAWSRSCAAKANPTAGPWTSNRSRTSPMSSTSSRATGSARTAFSPTKSSWNTPAPSWKAIFDCLWKAACLATWSSTKCRSRRSCRPGPKATTWSRRGNAVEMSPAPQEHLPANQCRRCVKPVVEPVDGQHLQSRGMTQHQGTTVTPQ